MGARGRRFPVPRRLRCAARPTGSRQQQARLRDWLQHSASLTARIRLGCRQFAVMPQREGLARCAPWERSVLRLQGPAHVREVCLLADGVPVVWARTVTARRGLRGAWRFLAALGTRPLGARLFTDPRIERSHFRFLPRYVAPAGAVVPVGLSLGVGAARFALLRRQGELALLIEVLLPAICGLP